MGFLDINGGEFLILVVLAIVLIGPTRMPTYARQLAGWVRALRTMAQQAKEKVNGELGGEFDDFDWQALDPRQYDPRRIVRDALREPIESGVASGDQRRTASAPAAPGRAPFDDEAT